MINSERQTYRGGIMDEKPAGLPEGGECSGRSPLITPSTTLDNSGGLGGHGHKAPKRPPGSLETCTGAEVVVSNDFRRAPDSPLESLQLCTAEAQTSSLERFSRATTMKEKDRQMSLHGEVPLCSSARTTFFSWRRRFCHNSQRGNAAAFVCGTGGTQRQSCGSVEDRYHYLSRRGLSRQLPESTGPPSSAATSDWTGRRRSSRTRTPGTRQDILGKERRVPGFLRFLSRGKQKNDCKAGSRSRLLLRRGVSGGGGQSDGATRASERKVRHYGFTEENSSEERFRCDGVDEEGEVLMGFLPFGCSSCGGREDDETGRRRLLLKKGMTDPVRGGGCVVEEERQQMEGDVECCACSMVHQRSYVSKRRKTGKSFSHVEAQTGLPLSRQRLVIQRSLSASALRRNGGSVPLIVKGGGSEDLNEVHVRGGCRGRRWSGSDYRENAREILSPSPSFHESPDLSRLSPESSISSSSCFHLCHSPQHRDSSVSSQSRESSTADRGSPAGHFGSPPCVYRPPIRSSLFYPSPAASVSWVYTASSSQVCFGTRERFSSGNPSSPPDSVTFGASRLPRPLHLACNSSDDDSFLLRSRDDVATPRQGSVPALSCRSESVLSVSVSTRSMPKEDSSCASSSLPIVADFELPPSIQTVLTTPIALHSTPPPSITNSSDPANRFTRVKTVSFANLSECDSRGSRRSDVVASDRVSRTSSFTNQNAGASFADRRGTGRQGTSSVQGGGGGGSENHHGSTTSSSGLLAREASSNGSRHASNVSQRGTGAGGSLSLLQHHRSTQQHQDGGAVGAVSNVSLVKHQSKCGVVTRNIFRAFQNLAEHDLVFRMKEDLGCGGSSERSLRSVFADSKGSLRPGGGSIGGPGSPGGGIGGGDNNNLSRSGSTDVILRRFPLKFVDAGLEDLFAANINRWMTTRLILMGVLMLVVTSIMWPLMAWSFNMQDAFNHDEPLGIIFHSDMAVTVSVSILFIVVKIFRPLARHAELIADIGTFLVVTVWGVWNTIGSYHLETSYVKDVIGGQSGFVKLDKTSAWSTSQEASSAVAYLYGLLLIVQLDVVYPSRTRRTWQVHVMFFLLSSSSVIIRGAINPDFVPVPFVALRVATYLMLTIFLFIGRHATELQQRQTFYNWLTTRKRVDRLESDLKRQRENVKVSTAVEQLVDMVKQCVDLNQTLESEATDLRPEHRNIVHECTQTLSKCLSILTNTSNLYTVQFGDLDSDSHRDIVQAFLNDHNSSPADWTRVTTAAYTRGFDDICWNSHPSASGVCCQQQGDAGEGVPPINAYFDSSVVVTPFGSYLSTDGITNTPPAASSSGVASGGISQPYYPTAAGVSPAPQLPGTCNTPPTEGVEEDRGEEPISPVGGENGVKTTVQGGTRPAGARAALPAFTSEPESKGGRDKPSVARRASVGRVRDKLTARRDGTPASRGPGFQQHAGRKGIFGHPGAGVGPGGENLRGIFDPQVYRRFEALAEIIHYPPKAPELRASNFVVYEREVQEWGFDCLRHASLSPSPLVDVGFALLERTCDDLYLPGSDVVLRFLKAVEVQYNPVPYHNCIHGLMVAQKMVALTELLGLNASMDSRDRALMVVAGLCHDIGHPGRNNALFINALDPVAVLYNDKSVLENYHSCLTFKTLELPDCDIFMALRTKEYHVVRSLIIDLILATDMKNHFETVSRFRVRRNALDFDMAADEDFWFVIKMIMKCADISHCGVDWSQHFQWCQRLSVEFYDQGDEELARRLPISPLCDREKHGEVAKSQFGFMNFVAIPLFEELVAVDQTGNVERECLTLLRSNASNWESLSSSTTPIPLLGQAVAAAEVKSQSFLHLVDGSGSSVPRPGSKAAEILSSYSHGTLTTVDLTALVSRTQLTRARRGSQQSATRRSET
ncbi:3 5 -cyclic nucleotide phosphodiesterase domain-containing protein [Cystoisospora suis]|uniref:Phosphodiesterase n=1 Tax=Cystoisospora suis TaxID=483139 RepID=A0A2C6LE64_9APIC|nr:3 5 -cyclic nucleotide phosphodiesterase domain-containing protein [Cystoisospora suis]